VHRFNVLPIAGSSEMHDRPPLMPRVFIAKYVARIAQSFRPLALNPPTPEKGATRASFGGRRKLGIPRPMKTQPWLLRKFRHNPDRSESFDLTRQELDNCLKRATSRVDLLVTWMHDL
jgi:hypothetical protein